MINTKIVNTFPKYPELNTIYEINGVGYLPRHRDNKIVIPIIWETLSESKDNEFLEQLK